ncbi:MAG: nuclear transport factor 2 family protein [Kofleriaceae bacterium]|nr:nuclear transport factor 2 family protein [Kofleriaceae bacterium]
MENGSELVFVPEMDDGFEALKGSLESTVLENYTQLTYNNLEAIVDSLATERELHFLGVTPNDVVIGVEPEALSKDRRLYPDRSPKVLSKNLDVHLSSDASVAWVYDEISYRVQYMNREASIPIRLTAIYVRDGERWVLVAEHRSYGVGTEELVELSTSGELRRGKLIENGYGDDKKLAITLLGIVGKFINNGEGIHPNDKSLVVFHEPAVELRFPFSDDTLSLAKRFSPDATVALREFRVQVSRTQTIAWIVANLSVTTEVEGERRELPLRGTFVLEKLPEQGWGLVQAHIAVPLLERQISQRIFGPNR